MNKSDDDGPALPSYQEGLDKRVPAMTYERQIERQLKLKKEIAELAVQLDDSLGRPCAIVLIVPDSDDYDDVVDPGLILEDALRVSDIGWPDGFSVELLNPEDV